VVTSRHRHDLPSCDPPFGKEPVSTGTPLAGRLATVAVVLFALLASLAVLPGRADSGSLTQSGFTTALRLGSSVEARQVSQLDLVDALEPHRPVADPVRGGIGQPDGKYAHAQRLGVQPGPTSTEPPSPTAPLPTGDRAHTESATGQSEQVRPFDMPSAPALRASPKKVYAHYFTPFPISIDNREPSVDYWARNYLSMAGENGKWAPNGGLLRDRPFPRPINRSSGWFVEDMRTEVRNARSAGIDGFTVDMLNLTGMHWDRLNSLLTAASQVDPNFDIVLMPDSTMRSVVADPNVLADKIASIASHPSVAHLADGRLVVAPFAPERVGVEFWNTFISRMRTSWGIEVALVPTFVNYGSNVAAFAPISYMLSSFGARNPQANRGVSQQGADAHARGKPWMQPVSLQDNRPKSGVFDEAHNSETLRTTWQAAIDLDAEWVNIVTWNDYGEHTHFAPSVNTGWSPLDISSYYLTWFKTGAPPRIVRDAAYVSHRVQFASALPSSGHSILMRPRALSTTPRDAVEVLTFLTAPARITATVGSQVTSWVAPAGIAVRTVPLQTGSISVRINHASGATTVVDTRQSVVNPPYVQDLQYRFVSSLREGRRVGS
jgi:hypothetical protein